MARRRPVANPRHRSPACQIDYEHLPPFAWRIADDLSLPHVWDIVRAFVDPAQRGGAPLGRRPRRPGAVHVRRGAGGFALGGLLGLALGIMLRPLASRRAGVRALRRRVADRADPGDRAARRRRASRPTGCRSWPSPAYLTFFPVTIARCGACAPSTRGPSSCSARMPRPGARSSGSCACRRRCRTCSRASGSPRPPSVIGAIIGEQTSGVPSGLGSAIINYNQYYTSGPGAAVGDDRDVHARRASSSSGIVKLAELLLTRGRYRPVEGLL